MENIWKIYGKPILTHGLLLRSTRKIAMVNHQFPHRSPVVKYTLFFDFAWWESLLFFWRCIGLLRPVFFVFNCLQLSGIGLVI